MQNLTLISLSVPFVSFLFASTFALRQRSILLGFVCSLLTALSAICSLILFFRDASLNITLSERFVGVNLGFDIDAVSLSMMSVIGVMATCVHFYSIFYMEKDEGFNKFSAYLGPFIFSMLFLVMSDNLLGLFVGWEGVGLYSWLLIGSWYHNDKHSSTANEASAMSGIADLGVLFGIFWLCLQAGAFKYNEIFVMASSPEHNTLILIANCLFISAMGKLVQFPLHTWLADAMAGPTPISAFICAATMVTTGVYLVIRAKGIYDLVPEVGYITVILDAFVALFATSMTLVARDLKCIIAYSTLSQLGYMFVVAGLGAYALALFHLGTHAFLRSLLFLGAGNVMHVMDDELDIRKMGGLAKPLEITAIFMTIASLVLAGICPLAGSFSKDSILGYALISFHYGIFLTLLTVAFMAAFYSSRLLMLVFFTPKRHHAYPHKASRIALFTMSPLVILALISGSFEHGFLEYLSTKLVFIDARNDLVMILASVVAVLGVLLAIIVYRRAWFKESIEQKSIYKLSQNNYFTPRFYHYLLVAEYDLSCELARKFNVRVLDAFVCGVCAFILRISQAILMPNSLNLMLYFIVGTFVVLLLLAWGV